MILAQDNAGNLLLDFDRRDPAEAGGSFPMPLALVVAVHDGRVLVVRSRDRREWELPGGMLEPGESPAVAAARELTEETGVVASSLAPVGVATFRLARGHGELGALYRTDVADGRLAHEPDDEIEAVAWWGPATDLDDLSPIDAWLARTAQDGTTP